MKRGKNVTLSLLLAGGALVWGYAMKTSAQPMLSPQDYIEIQQLYARYAYAVDAGDGQAYAALYTEDGSYGKIIGRTALIAAFGQPSLKARRARHFNSNLLITPTAEGADGRVYLTTYVAEHELTPKYWIYLESGIYTDKLVRTQQGWRFKSRLTHFDTASSPSGLTDCHLDPDAHVGLLGCHSDDERGKP